MSVVAVSRDIAEPLTNTFSVLALVSMIIVTLYHAATSYKYYYSTKQTDQNFKLSLFWTCSLFFWGIVEALLLVIVQYAPPNESGCKITSYLGLPPYLMFKLSVYVTLTLRVHCAFHGASELEYSVKKLKIWVGGITFWSILNLFLVNINAVYTFVPDRYPPCDYEPMEIGLMSMMLQDIVAGGVCGYLFVRPVLKLRGAFGKQKTENLKIVAIKQCILSLTAIITTVVALGGIIVFNMPTLWIGSDIVVSTISIILMYKWNKALFGWICCCVGGHTKSKEDISNLNLEVAMSNTGTTKGTSSGKEDTKTRTETEISDKPSLKNDMSLPLTKRDSNPIPQSDKIVIR